MRHLLLTAMVVLVTPALAAPEVGDRVYTADQNSNTVSVIDPVSNTLLGQIRLGNPRPEVLSPLYKGQVNVHGLGFSPDHKTLVAISTVTNSVAFIDTATNAVKGIAYVGRNPHEGFFTPDGTQVWVTVRGESHLAVVDPRTYQEIGRIPTTDGPGMVVFSSDGKLAFVCNSFNPVLEVIDVVQRAVVKRIPVVSPFSPFVQVSPDGQEVWLTHKDVGKVTRIDVAKLEVAGTIDTGPITNHLAFGRNGGRTLAYVTVGGENAVKVFTTGTEVKPVGTIPVGALPHGIWASGDGSRLYVGLENGDAIDVIDAEKNAAVARIPIGQAPQALVYMPGAAPGVGDSRVNLSPLPEAMQAMTVTLKPTRSQGGGSYVARTSGLVDLVDVSVSKLKPNTVYKVYLGDGSVPLAAFKTNDKGAGTVSAVGAVRGPQPDAGTAGNKASVLVVEGDTPPSETEAVLTGR